MEEGRVVGLRDVYFYAIGGREIDLKGLFPRPGLVARDSSTWMLGRRDIFSLVPHKYDWPLVHPPPVQNIIHHRDEHHSREHDNSPVHALRRDGCGDGEADENHSEAAVCECEEVDGQTEAAEGPLGGG